MCGNAEMVGGFPDDVEEASAAGPLHVFYPVKPNSNPCSVGPRPCSCVLAAISPQYCLLALYALRLCRLRSGIPTFLALVRSTTCLSRCIAMLLPSQYRVAVLVKGNNGAGYIELCGIVRARNLIWCDSDDPHGQVDIRFKQRQTRADLTLASDGHAEAERRSRVMPNPKGS